MGKAPSVIYAQSCALGLVLCLIGLAYCNSAGAQTDAAKRVAEVEHSGTEPSLLYILQVLEADPGAPPTWLQLGTKLAAVPGYEAPASVWLDAYLLALPNARDAAEIKNQIEKLRAVPTPRKREELGDRMEAMGLDVRGSLHESLGQRELAITDYERAIVLDPNQENARDGLGRLKGSSPIYSPE